MLQRLRIASYSRKFLVVATMCGAFAGCDNMVNNPSPNSSSTLDRAGDSSVRTPTSPTNTGVNVRDRDNKTLTPLDQNENQTDIDITAMARKRVLDANLSVNARNVKIVTQNGKVTLRGPVKDESEKQKIGEIAKAVAGVHEVDNQLEIAP